MRLCRAAKGTKPCEPNCQFVLNFDDLSEIKLTTLSFDKTNQKTIVFSIFLSFEFVSGLLERLPTVDVFTVFLLSTKANHNKIAALLGVKDAEWDELEVSVAKKFDKLIKKLF